MKLGPDTPDNEPTVEILERRLLHKAWATVEHIFYRTRDFAGGWAPPTDRILISPYRTRVAVVLPYDPVTDEFVLNEEFRIGAHDGGAFGWLLEASAGQMEEHESPEESARRELTEETGLHAKRLEQVASCFPAAGLTNEHVTCFVAEVDAHQRKALTGQAHEGEMIRTHVMPVATALEWLDAGRFNNEHLVLLLNWFARHHLALRARWLKEPGTPPERA